MSFAEIYDPTLDLLTWNTNFIPNAEKYLIGNNIKTST